MPYKVGRDRARFYRAALQGDLARFSIPPVATVRAAFTAHGDPRRGFLAFVFRWHQRGFPSFRALRGATSVVTTCPPLLVWPFAMYAAFPRADYYGHADSLQTHPRFWDGLPRPYFRSRSHRLEGLPCSHR